MEQRTNDLECSPSLSSCRPQDSEHSPLPLTCLSHGERRQDNQLFENRASSSFNLMFLSMDSSLPVEFTSSDIGTYALATFNRNDSALLQIDDDAVADTTHQSKHSIHPPTTNARLLSGATPPRKRRRVNAPQDSFPTSQQLSQTYREASPLPERGLQESNGNFEDSIAPYQMAGDILTHNMSESIVEDNMLGRTFANDMLGKIFALRSEIPNYANNNAALGATENDQGTYSTHGNALQSPHMPPLNISPDVENLALGEDLNGDDTQNLMHLLSNNAHEQGGIHMNPSERFSSPFLGKAPHHPPLAMALLSNCNSLQPLSHASDQTLDISPLDLSHLPGLYRVRSQVQPPMALRTAYESSLSNRLEKSSARQPSLGMSIEAAPEKTVSSLGSALIPNEAFVPDLEKSPGRKSESSAAGEALFDADAQQPTIQDLLDIHTGPKQQIVYAPTLTADENTQEHMHNNVSSCVSVAVGEVTNFPEQDEVLPNSSELTASQINVPLAPLQHRIEAREEEFSFETVVIKNPVQCDQCDNLSIDAEALEKHKAKSHSAEKVKGRCICMECGMDLKSDANHIRHFMTAHCGELKYSCEICQAKFSTKKAVVTHERDQHGKEPCSVQKRKTTNPQRKRRARSKTHLDLYKCRTCKYQTTVKGNMLRHIRVAHKKERPFVCNVCGEASKTKHNLQIHLVQHVDKRRRNV